MVEILQQDVLKFKKKINLINLISKHSLVMVFIVLIDWLSDDNYRVPTRSRS